MPTKDPIQLDRRFLELSETDIERATDRELALIANTKERSWEQILEHRCVVILGEAGTGKTTELEQRSGILAASGKAAFSLTVEDLATRGLEGPLTSKVQRRLAEWRDSAERGYFFLDAVDEAVLNGHRFKTALTRLEQALGEEIRRAHISITCRVSDWRAGSDRDAIAAILYPDLAPARLHIDGDTGDHGVGEQEYDDDRDRADLSGPHMLIDGGADPARQLEPTIRVFEIAPLDEERVERLVASLGISDPRSFTEAARRATAHAYLERPRDVEWLVSYWLQHRAFGNLSELVENDVTEKLIERNPRRHTQRGASLPPIRARAAAEVLAGMAALQRKSSFALPDGALDIERAATSLDPTLVLRDLSRPELDQLLTLPLFDLATYGRVRIHHRTVAEYLAAGWLHALLRRGVAPAEIEALLLRSGSDGPVIPTELVAVAAWLATSDKTIRERLLEVAPTVLLEGGDPNSFPEEFRRRLLEAIAAQYAARKRLFKSFDPVTLGRLASSGIAETINSLLETSTQGELLQLLLTIVGEGGLQSCAEQALRLAREVGTPLRARLEAVRAVAKAGTPQQIETLIAAVIDASGEIDHSLGGALVGATYPAALTVKRLLVLLSRVHAPPPQTGTLLPHLISGAVYRDTQERERVRLIHGVLDLVSTKDESTQIRRTWLWSPLARMTAQYASEHSGSSLQPLESVFQSFAQLGGHWWVDVDHGGSELRDVATTRTDLRRMMFWAQAMAIRATKRNLSRFIEMHGIEQLLIFGNEDLGWLERDAENRADPRDRLLAFDCLMAAPFKDVNDSARSEIIQCLAAANSAFQRRYERAHRLHHQPRKESMSLRWLRIHQARQKRDHENWIRWLYENLNSVENGTAVHALESLAFEIRTDPRQPKAAEAKLAQSYGPTIARAIVAGLRRLWRRLRCPLPHEEERQNISSYSRAGFTGLTLEIDSGLELRDLKPEEARAAARYATRSLNEFPGWIDQLAQTHPTAVSEIFGECIRADFIVPVEAEPTYNVLHLLSNACVGVRELCAPMVAELLIVAAREPPRLDTLDQCLEVLIATPSSHQALSRVVAARCVASSQDRERFALWWCAWLVVAPSTSIEALQVAIEREPDSSYALVLAICDRLWRFGEYSRIEFPLPSVAADLTRLLAVVLAHISPEDDARHDNWYSPDARDHAQSLRRYLLDLLSGTPGDGAYRGLRDLAEIPKLANQRDYLLSLADQRLSRDAGRRDTGAADRLVRAYEQYGLGAIEHLEEAGLQLLPPGFQLRKQNILFLAANPSDTDARALDREARAIRIELERSGHRDRFDLETRWAAEPLDLLDQLRKVRPAVVHFSGRGGREGLFFQGADGRSRLVTTDAFAETFGAVEVPIQVVVLSACYSKEQADSLLEHVTCVVGTPNSISDDAARSFAIGFYGGLGERASVELAYRQGCAAISLEGTGRPKEGHPQLKVREGIDAGALVLAAGPRPLAAR